MKDILIIAGVSCIILLVTFFIFPVTEPVSKIQSTPASISAPKPKKLIQIIVDKQGNECYTIITREEK
jgi:hypothetical protein